MTALVQSKVAVFSSGGSATYDSNPTAGHLLVATLSYGGTANAATLTGWTEVADGGATGYPTNIWYRAAPGGSVTVTPSVGGRLTIMEFDTAATLADSEVDGGTWPSPTGDGVGTFTVSNVVLAGAGILVGIVAAGDPGGGGHTNYTEDAAYTNLTEGGIAGGFTPDSMHAYRIVSAGTYSYSPTGVTTAGGHPSWGGILAAFVASVPFTADFEGTPRSGSGPLSVAFTDESHDGTGTPNAWLWDFGDGGTSTSQNPTHVYDAPGTYTVTLTVTTDDAESDSETKVGYITVEGDYVAPDPGGAILEIKASAPGSYRWDFANWDEAVWSSAEWVDVTPQGITVQIRWGSHSPERGILAEAEAASWLVTTYDPDRLLDPGNPDSPYHADLRAGLPIRLRHRGTIIRQGVVERIAYSHADKQGGIRATDNISIMARTPVPEDSIVADTLRARARDVIAAAGLSITVEPDPPAGDPALAPRIEGVRSVWRHIADGAEQTLHVAYVDRIGTVKFRPWATPYDRGRGVDERNLVDLMTQVDTAGLYSVVQARDSITEAIVERAITPTPRYGRIVYTRDELTIDAGDWADTVLTDRAFQTTQWIPGLIWPLTADEVEYYATLEAVERFGVEHHEATPDVDITGVIIGGTVSVKGKRESAALWTFELELAQTADSPLYTDTDPPEFLFNETGDGYLYAD